MSDLKNLVKIQKNKHHHMKVPLYCFYLKRQTWIKYYNHLVHRVRVAHNFNNAGRINVRL